MYISKIWVTKLTNRQVYDHIDGQTKSQIDRQTDKWAHKK